MNVIRGILFTTMSNWTCRFICKKQACYHGARKTQVSEGTHKFTLFHCWINQVPWIRVLFRETHLFIWIHISVIYHGSSIQQILWMQWQLHLKMKTTKTAHTSKCITTHYHKCLQIKLANNLQILHYLSSKPRKRVGQHHPFSRDILMTIAHSKNNVLISWKITN